MEDWITAEDNQYRRVKTTQLEPGDVVVWGRMHDERPQVVAVYRTRWFHRGVMLRHPDDRIELVERSTGTVWYVLR